MSHKGIRQRGRPVTFGDTQDIGAALGTMAQALRLLDGAGAYNSAAYLRRAIKSARGAHTHAVHRYYRQRDEEPQVCERCLDAPGGNPNDPEPSCPECGRPKR